MFTQSSDSDALRDRSDALHVRVQQFAESNVASDSTFESLAIDIARYQFDAIASYRRLVQSTGCTLTSLADIPAVPVEAFRLTRVAAHPKSQDAVTFLTSGTTSGLRGGHHLRRTDTYRKVALLWGRQALVVPNSPPMQVICLAPAITSPESSSLGFMMRSFLEEFGLREHADRKSAWLLEESRLDIDGLYREIEVARVQSRPLLVLATSFALVYLLEALGGQVIADDPRTVVMQTGGFKGKTRDVDASQLRREVARAFGISELSVVSEYGMTELCSQLYEGTLPSGGLRSEVGWYVAPPWMRVEALCPMTHARLPEGSEGLACFTDLANVDSAVRIVTMDRVVCRGQSLQLLGRYEGAPPRGCSLAIEEMLA